MGLLNTKCQWACYKLLLALLLYLLFGWECFHLKVINSCYNCFMCFSNYTVPKRGGNGGFSWGISLKIASNKMQRNGPDSDICWTKSNDQWAICVRWNLTSDEEVQKIYKSLSISRGVYCSYALKLAAFDPMTEMWECPPRCCLRPSKNYLKTASGCFWSLG